MITYQQEVLRQVEQEIVPLAKEDWEEIEHDKERKPFDPDWDTYYQLEDMGCLYIFTARLGKKLIGYYTALVVKDMHSRDNRHVYNDLIFLSKSHRKGLTGVKLMKFAEKCIKEDGHKVLHVGTTERNPIDPILERLGYVKTETKFEKVL